MFLVQTGQARRTQKYSILMVFIMVMMGAVGGIMLTMHWDVLPKKK